MHPQVSETIYSPDAEKYPGVNIQKMWKTHGFRFGKWSTNGGFPQIFVSLQEGNRYMLYRYYNVK